MQRQPTPPQDPPPLTISVDANQHFMPRAELQERLKDVEDDMKWVKRIGGVAVAVAVGLLGVAITALVRFWPAVSGSGASGS